MFTRTVGSWLLSQYDDVIVIIVSGNTNFQMDHDQLHGVLMDERILYNLYTLD